MAKQYKLIEVTDAWGNARIAKEPLDEYERVQHPDGGTRIVKAHHPEYKMKKDSSGEFKPQKYAHTEKDNTPAEKDNTPTDNYALFPGWF